MEKIKFYIGKAPLPIILFFIVLGCVNLKGNTNGAIIMKTEKMSRISEEKAKDIAIQKAIELEYDIENKDVRLLETNFGWLVYIEPKKKQGYVTLGGVLILYITRHGNIAKVETLN